MCRFRSKSDGSLKLPTCKVIFLTTGVVTNGYFIYHPEHRRGNFDAEILVTPRQVRTRDRLTDSRFRGTMEFRGLLVFLFAVVAVRPDAAAPDRCPDPGDWKCEFLDPLEEAIGKGDREAVRRLAAAKDEKGRTALHAASYFDLPDTAQLLLDSGADVNAADEDGYTPLHVAPGPGTVKVVKVLVANGADISARTAAKASATGCEPSYDWKCRYLDPLREAIGKGDREALRRLATAVDRKGRTALHAASYFDLPDFAEILLESGADVNAADEDGYTPLHVAAGHSTAPLVKVLLDHGADVNARMGRRGNSEVPPSDCPSDDWLCQIITPLVTAAVEGGDPAATRLLMEAVDDQGRTALHVATQYDVPGAVEWLLENGFPVDTVDKRGRPASYVAAEYNRPKIMEILLKGGADANFKPGKQKWEKQQKKKALQKCA